MAKIQYCSTNRNRRGGFKQLVTFQEALFMGLAPDHGLFMPNSIPKIAQPEITHLQGKPYYALASYILEKFLSPEIAPDVIRTTAKEIYNFPVPIKKVNRTTSILELFHGPTASFKDFGAQFMAKMIAIHRPQTRNITILVATSGDTGSAVGEAFRNLEGISVNILYPKNEVSELQKHTLDTIGKNVQAIEIDGKFDDCQAIVKKAFADKDLKKLNFSTGNSINIGRLLPQVCYYVYTWLKIQKPITFVIPSGNFGNALGCELARRMGLPLKMLIAVNANDEFPKYLNSGIYKKLQPSKICISNAMNIGNPSNLSRFFDLFGGNVDKEGIVHQPPDRVQMKRHISSIAITDAQTKKTIQNIWKQSKIIIDPHTAVAFGALENSQQAKGEMFVVVSTADPAKFPIILKREIHIYPPTGKNLRKLLKRMGKPIKMDNRYLTIKKYWQKNGLD